MKIRDYISGIEIRENLEEKDSLQPISRELVENLKLSKIQIVIIHEAYF